MHVFSKSTTPLITKSDFRKISTEELLSILIDIKSKYNSSDVVKQVLEYLRSKNNDDITANELMQFDGISQINATRIISALEFGRRFYKNKSKKKLSDEDWDFFGLKQSERQCGVHFFHHYAAKFIPQIPAKLIRNLSRVNDLILDPFMGSATTLVESKLLGFNSIGLDTNPLAIKIAKAKTMKITENKLKEINTFLNIVEKKKKNDKNGELESPDTYLFDMSSLWFRDDVASKVKFLLLSIEKYLPDVKNFIEIGISDLLKGMSNVRMDSVEPVLPKSSTYIDKKHYFRQVDNLTRNIPVFGRVYSQINKMKAAILEFNKESDSHLICKPTLADARELCKHVEQANLIVTSPPYWSAKNYEKIHMLSFKVLNLKTEIGKEIGRNSKSYLSDMKIVFDQIASILDGYFAIVIGEDSRKQQHEKIFALIKESGLMHEDTIVRRISNQTSRAKQIKNEYIYIFKS